MGTYWMPLTRGLEERNMGASQPRPLTALTERFEPPQGSQLVGACPGAAMRALGKH
jgi:hypothetical protein